MTSKKSEFASEITSKLKTFYSFDDSAYAKKQSLGDEIEGFLKAGVLLEVITREEFLAIADHVHKLIHGKSIKQQNLDVKTGIKKADKNWQKYDEPAYIRKKK